MAPERARASTRTPGRTPGRPRTPTVRPDLISARLQDRLENGSDAARADGAVGGGETRGSPASEPELPEELDDRAWEAWEPLIAIAYAVGGSWPELARRAALELSTGEEAEDDSIGVQLLADIASVFKGDVVQSGELCRELNRLEDAPWGGWGRDGQGLNQRSLARELRRFASARAPSASPAGRRRAIAGGSSPMRGRATSPVPPRRHSRHPALRTAPRRARAERHDDPSLRHRPPA